ncbi:MAG: hypothetical protein AAF962_27365 [Actinomycetota bacterium]
MGRRNAGAAALVGLALVLSACGGGDADRDALIDDRLRIGNTQEQAECYADAVLDEFGEDPSADGELSDDDVTKLADFAFGCVGGADG